jgi:hypothetical protein
MSAFVVALSRQSDFTGSSGFTKNRPRICLSWGLNVFRDEKRQFIHKL